MVIWMIHIGIVMLAIFIFFMIIGVMATIITKISDLELPIMIAFIIGVIVFFCYIMDKKKKR